MSTGKTDRFENAGSVRPDEVEFFEKLAHTWWDLSGPFWPLHKLNAVRVAYLCERLCLHFAGTVTQHKPLHGLNLLDVGCGGGILSEAMAHEGANVHGIDVVHKNIRVAQAHASQQVFDGDLKYEAVSAEALAAREHQYDVVLNMEVVEHVDDLAGFVRACSALTRPGGLMFIATLNRTLTSFVTAIVGAEYVLRWLPRGTHEWRRFPQPRELESTLDASGLAVRDRVGVRVNPFNRHFSITSSLRVNYMFEAVKRES